jgi:hypothetical protein
LFSTRNSLKKQCKFEHKNLEKNISLKNTEGGKSKKAFQHAKGFFSFCLIGIKNPIVLECQPTLNSNF